MIFGTSKPKIQEGMTSSQRRMFDDLMSQVRQMQSQYAPATQQGLGYLQNMFDPNSYASLEAPAMRQFQEEIIPGIAERFSAMGAGSQSSSSFRNQLGRAGVDLGTNLANLRQQGMMQALPQALQLQQYPMQYGQSLFGSSLGSNIAQAPMPGMIAPMLQSFGKAIGSKLGSMNFFGGGSGGGGGDGGDMMQMFAKFAQSMGGG
jgi:hypothetical protein